MAEINDHVLDAVREMRRSLKPKRIKKERGRPTKRNQARVRKLKKKRDQADKLFRRRHLILTKRSNISTQDAETLEELLNLSPKLRTLRAFVDDFHALFQVKRTKKKA